MTPQEFFDKYNGKGIDFDKAWGNQCMDLAQQYVTECFGNPPLKNSGSAWTCWNNQDSNLYEQINNTPTGVPQKGDIMIWNTGVGQYGHIAVFVSGDTNSFTSFDQNWPLNVDANGKGLGVCHYQSHNYNSVQGWFRPKVSNTISIDKSTFENLVTKSGKFDDFVNAGFNSAKEATQAVQKLTEGKHSVEHDKELLQQKVNEQMKQIIETEAKLALLTAQNNALQEQVDYITDHQDLSQIKPFVNGWIIYLRSYRKLRALAGL